VVVRDLNLVGISSLPSKTQAILVVNTNAVLPVPVSAQPFQAIPVWNGKLAEVSDSINLIELSPNHLPQIPWTDPSSNRRVDAIKAND
jgi:hypothetical protein